MKLSRILASVAVAALALPTAAGIASAEPLDRFTYYEEFTHYRSCANGLELRIDGVNDGRVLVVEHGDDAWGYGSEHVDNTWTVTNLATGATYRGINKGLVFKDQKLIDNGDGTSTLLVNSPAEVVIWAPDGSVAYRGAGLAVYEFLVTGDGLEYVDTVATHGFSNLVGNTCDTAASFWL